jgi:hypothetical protein
VVVDRTVVDKWSLFRGRFSTNIAWAGFGMVAVDKVVANTNLTVLKFFYI